jgi:hypothetical protein
MLNILIVDYDSYLSYKNDSLHPKMSKEMSSLYFGLEVFYLFEASGALQPIPLKY